MFVEGDSVCGRGLEPRFSHARANEQQLTGLLGFAISL